MRTGPPEPYKDVGRLHFLQALAVATSWHGGVMMTPLSPPVAVVGGIMAERSPALSWADTPVRQKFVKAGDIPPALYQLMQDLSLASSASAPRILPDLSEEQYGDFFNHPGQGKGEGWFNVRLQVLEFVGGCATLMSLDLSLLDIVRELEVESICRGLRSNPVLVDLRLSYNPGFGSEEGCQHLARVLLSCCSLQVLLLNGVDMTFEGLSYITEALLANEQSSLHYLDISGNRNLGDAGAKCIAELLGAQFTGLRTLMMYDIGMGWAGAQQLARGLVRNTTLKELFLGDEGSCPKEHGHTGSLTTLLRALTNPSAEAHTLSSDHLQNTSVTTLDLVLADEKGLGSTVARMLRTNSSLRSLSLRHSRFSRTEWKNIFKSLHKNTSLEYLDLHNCKGLDNYLFTELMELLEVNSSLKTINLNCTPWNSKGKWIIELLQENTLMDILHIETFQEDAGDDASWKSDGREAAEKEALKRNAEQAAYLAVLRERLKFVPPRTGRLFVCGSPLAGKTTLRKAMVRCSLSTASWIQRVVFKGRSLMLHKQSACFPPWTGRHKSKGFEVEMLRDDAEMQLSVWDMPGQAEFHTLHDYLVPDMNQPCVFVFVFSLFDYQTGAVRLDAESDLERELVSWLRFIASNRSPNHVLPQVCVVLSHLDRVSGWTQERIVDWASETVDTLRDQFQGVLDLSPTIHAVNGLSGKSVRPLMDHVFTCFKYQLSHELPLVPDACNQMSLLLADWASAHSTHPILKEEEFYNLCASKVDALKHLLLDPHAHCPEEVCETVQQNRQAVLAYLHDAGSIIHFQDLKFVVINPNWLAHVFLGRLVRLREQFQGPNEKRFDGFLRKEELELVLEDFLRSSRYSGFTVEDLLSLMLELEICYEDIGPGNPAGSRYFIPSALEDYHDMAGRGVRQLTWPLGERGRNCIYIGRRLQCADLQRTILTAGFFPRFQVVLRNRVVSKLGVYPEEYRNDKHLISMLIDGMEILVERSGDIGPGYVDVLVRSSKSPIQTMDFVRDYIVQELHAFCPKACPGVELVEAILRPDCVKELTLCIYRERQAVLVEDLKADLMQQLMDEDILYRDHEEIFSLAASLEHKFNWPEEPASNLEAGRDSAVDLLGARDLMKAIDHKLRFLTQQRIHIEEAAIDVMLHCRAQADSKAQNRISLSERQIRLLRRVGSRSSLDSRHSLDLSKTARHNVGDLMVENFLKVTKQLDRAAAKMDEKKVLMKAILPEVKGIQSLQEDVLCTLMLRMNDVMGFSAQFHQRKMPRLPFFTDSDVGMLQRFSAVMRIGKSVKLHFMCEDRSKKHYVPEQIGCEMTLEDGKWRRLRPLAMGATKLLYIMLRAGLPAVPFPFPVLGAASSLAMDSLLQDIRMNEPTSAADFNDAWLCLQDFLRPRMDLISSLFQLYHVRYTRGEPREVAWVCKACRQKGLQKDILQDYWPH